MCSGHLHEHVTGLQRKGDLEGVAGCVDEGDSSMCIRAGLQVDAAISWNDGNCGLDSAFGADHNEPGRASLHRHSMDMSIRH